MCSAYVLSAALVPAAPRFGDRIATLLGTQAAFAKSDVPSEIAPDVVIIGFGPAGQIAARPFIDRDCRVTVIDLNREGVRLARQLGFHGTIGDATLNEVLEHAQVAQSKVVVITVPHHYYAKTILEQVRQQSPQTHVVVRSRCQIHTNDFVVAGCTPSLATKNRLGRAWQIISGNGSTLTRK